VRAAYDREAPRCSMSTFGALAGDTGSPGEQPAFAFAMEDDDAAVVLELECPGRSKVSLPGCVNVVGGDDADHPELTPAELHHDGTPSIWMPWIGLRRGQGSAR
jgi:hypothetical protein